MRCGTERPTGSYDRGSALNIATVTKVICDTLTSCGADQTALDNCAKAAAAAKQQPEGTGAQADAFNAVFGLKTVRGCSSFAPPFLVSDHKSASPIRPCAVPTRQCPLPSDLVLSCHIRTLRLHPASRQRRGRGRLLLNTSATPADRPVARSSVLTNPLLRSNATEPLARSLESAAK